MEVTPTREWPFSTIDDKTLARIYDEKTELDKKLVALRSFLRTETCQEMEPSTADLLRAQFVVMHRYSEILGARIQQWQS